MVDKKTVFGRDVVLRVRQCDVLKLNTSPEKAGVDLAKKADLIVEFIVRTEELEHILDIIGGPTKLWDKEGTPIITELDGRFNLKTVAIGVAKIGYTKGTAEDFSDAKLKKMSIEPMLDTQIKVHGQIRVDPGRSLDMLYDLVIERKAKIGFVGKVLLQGDPDEEPDEDVNQGKLPV